jgi:excisionase family DNA binding protein
MSKTFVGQAEKLAYSVEEISEQSSLSIDFLRKEIREGRLKVRRAGRRILILKSDFMNYIGAGENTDEK